MEFNKYFDHTILSPDASYIQVEKICTEAIANNFASVCVNSYRTKMVSDLLKGSDILTCTVIGFPLGAQPYDVKVFETKKAIEDGADEIDMVVNIGAIKDNDWETVEVDIKKVKDACGKNTLKVIIETCLLTEDEKEKACEVAVKAGADFLKTSTGFSKSGAEVEDIELFKRVLKGRAKIKASGGIRDFEKADAMIKAGADRLGTSATLDIINHYPC